MMRKIFLYRSNASTKYHRRFCSLFFFFLLFFLFSLQRYVSYLVLCMETLDHFSLSLIFSLNDFSRFVFACGFGLNQKISFSQIQISEKRYVTHTNPIIRIVWLLALCMLYSQDNVRTIRFPRYFRRIVNNVTEEKGNFSFRNSFKARFTFKTNKQDN